MFQIVIERCYVMLLRQTMYLNSYDHTLKLVHNHLALLAGSVAEWSKALVLGTSHFGGVGSNPTTINLFPYTFFEDLLRGKGNSVLPY